MRLQLQPQQHFVQQQELVLNKCCLSSSPLACRLHLTSATTPWESQRAHSRSSRAQESLHNRPHNIKKLNYPKNKSALYFHLTQLVINCVSEFWIYTASHSLPIIHSFMFISHREFQSKHIFSAGVCVNHPTHTFHGLVIHIA